MPPLEATTYRVDPVSGVGFAGPDEDTLPRRLAACLAHNVNNSLAGVISYLELALREADQAGAVRQRLREAMHCAYRAAERVRRTVAFARRPEVHVQSAVCLRRAAEQAARAAAEWPGVAVTLQ